MRRGRGGKSRYPSPSQYASGSAGCDLFPAKMELKQLELISKVVDEIK